MINKFLFGSKKKDIDKYNQLNFTTYEIVSIWYSCSGVNINIVYPCEVKDKHIYIYSGGNMGNIWTNRKWIQFLAKTCKCTVISYDYPGYSGDDKETTEDGCIQYLRTVVDYCSGYKITLIGRSLGTGVTIGYAEKYGWTDKIVLISPFTSIADIIYDKCLWLFRPLIQPIKGYLSGHMFNSIDKVKRIDGKFYIYIGINDNLILPQQSLKISENVKNLISITYIKDTHRDIIHKMMEAIDGNVWKS